MRILFTLFGLFLAVFAASRLGRCDAADVIVLGKDRLVFTNERALTSPWEQVRISSRFGTERKIAAGRPFRCGVELLDVKLGSPGCNYVHLKDVYDILDYGNIDCYIEKIETDRDFRAALSRVQNVGSEDWLSPDRLRSLFRLIEAAPKELRLKIATKEFEADLITKGVFHRNDVWLAAFVVQEGASIVEFKVAIDRKNRVAYHRRVLVQGPAPPLSGAGVFTRAGNAAFAVAYPFLRNAIEESKKGRRP